MIGFWNRKEIYMGYSMSIFNDIRDILDQNDIKYKYKVFNNTSSMTRGSNRNVRVNIGKDGEQNYMYYIYVHNKDYDHASALIRQVSQR